MTAGRGDGDGDPPDRELWQRVTEGVRPLRKRSPPPPRRTEAAPGRSPVDDPAPSAAKTPPVQSRRPATSAVTGRRGSAPPPELAPGVAAGLDKRTLAKLRRGLIVPERRIDLHAMTQNEAHAALDHFLAGAQAAGKRCVLVITGKGTRADGSIGVLRTNVPHWLNLPNNRARILAFTHAAPADGGEGALYVLLRRVRESRDGG